MIDPSKVKVDDTVVIKATVSRTELRTCWRVGTEASGSWWISPDDPEIAEHIPAPRKIEVGSRVEIQLSDRRLRGVVHAIVGDNAAVEWFGSSNYLGLPLVEMLEVID